MRLSCDAGYIPHDPALPGLETLLDPTAFADILTRIAPSSPAQRVEISYIKYKPHTNCLVGYRLSGDGVTVDAYARALRRKDFVAANDETSLTHAEQAIELRFFPSDRQIVGLRKLDSESQPRLLGRLLRRQDATWRNSHLERLVYKPERRYVAQVQIDGEPHAALKFYTRTGYPVTQQAWQPADCTTLRVARVLGRYERRAIIAYEWLAGRLAHSALCDPATDAGVFMRVGMALAELHDQPPGEAPLRTSQHEAHALHAAAAAIAAVCPSLARRAQQLAERLARAIEQQPVALGLIHGDFYARQAILQDNTVALIDFDEAAYGDRMDDMANFLAHLEYDVLRGALQRSRAEAIGAALLTGYQWATNAIIGQSLALRMAARLLLLAPHPFRTREPAWPVCTAAILERVAQLAQSKER